jgi:hypothetical protein
MKIGVPVMTVIYYAVHIFRTQCGSTALSTLGQCARETGGATERASGPTR